MSNTIVVIANLLFRFPTIMRRVVGDHTDTKVKREKLGNALLSEVMYIFKCSPGMGAMKA